MQITHIKNNLTSIATHLGLASLVALGWILYLPSLNAQDCDPINFNSYNLSSYGGSQDEGQANIQDGGLTLVLTNNAWKSIDFSHTVNSNTVLEVEFRSTQQGEIHGIGFDTDNSLSDNRTFRFFGTQNWGISNFDNYSTSDGWKKYTINVGQFYTGSFNRVFFAMDHDGGSGNGNAYFRNLIIRNTDCGSTGPTCSDGIQNGNETGVDCGGDCDPCPETCSDGIQNQNETGIDCGGVCPDCPTAGSGGLWSNSGSTIYYNTGVVGIGISNPDADARLTVNGNILGKEVRIKSSVSTYPDYVFNPGYQLPTLKNLESYIHQNRHLPDIPTATEVAKEGIYLGDMSQKLLRKIEELTLYTIEQQKEIEELRKQIKELEKRIK